MVSDKDHAPLQTMLHEVLDITEKAANQNG